MQALLFLLDLAGKVVVGIFLLRFFMQLTRANFRNPIAVALVRFSNPVVLPLRRLIPGWGGMDIASLVAAFAVQAGVIFILGLLFSPAGLSGFSLTGLLLRALLTLLQSSISLYVLLVFFSVLLSWFNRDPYNPLANLVNGLTEPLLAPARRLIPPLGGLDLSPVIVLIALQALSILVATELLPRLL
jgi:YggT family protein